MPRDFDCLLIIPWAFLVEFGLLSCFGFLFCFGLLVLLVGWLVCLGVGGLCVWFFFSLSCTQFAFSTWDTVLVAIPLPVAYFQKKKRGKV